MIRARRGEGRERPKAQGITNQYRAVFKQ